MNKWDYTTPAAGEVSAQWVPAADLPLDVILAAEHSLPLQLWHTCCGMCGAGTPERTGCAVAMCPVLAMRGDTDFPQGCVLCIPAAQHVRAALMLFLGTRCHMQEGMVLFLSPACQTTTEKLTINLKA